MKIHRTALVMIVVAAAAGLSFAGEELAVKPGLVAHYFRDHENWEGAWPDALDVPRARPADWTFTEYEYSRVEPLINHRFVRQGWFSIRWKGYFDPMAPPTTTVAGRINLNPHNRADDEFSVVLADGTTVTRDDLHEDYPGCSAVARSIRIRPKGNGNQNGLTVGGEPYPLRNADMYEITGAELNVRIYNDRVTAKAKAAGRWWLEIEAEAATITCNDTPAGPAPPGAARGNEEAATYFFEIFADDGCRLWIDGEPVIDDWRACWEGAPAAHRKARGVRLADGRHEIVVEYFQGQSLADDEDQDPMVLKWSCPSRGIRSQVIPAEHFSHGVFHLRSWKRPSSYRGAPSGPSKDGAKTRSRRRQARRPGPSG